MFPAELTTVAARLVDDMRERGLKLATAESCTGGLISGLITEIPGSSDVFERGFVTYSNEAKAELLGVPASLILARGAVSAEVAAAMASGALAHSPADVAVAVTGVAGPGGGTAAKPVGLVHVAAGSRDGRASGREFRFGPLSRSEIRLATMSAALDLVRSVLPRG